VVHAVPVQFTVRSEAPPVQSFDAELGSPAGPRHLAFTEITDVAISPAGGHYTYVLDGKANRVHVYDRQLRHLGSFGEAGAGNGRTISPRAVAVDDDLRVYVGDYDGRIEVFDSSNPKKVSYLRTLRIPMHLFDMCVIGNNLYLLGLRRSALSPLHRVHLDSGETSSFGEIYNSTNQLVLLTSTDGKIACSAQTGTIAYAPVAVINEVWGFSAEGEALWRVTLNNFKSPQLTENKSAVAIAFPKEGFHRTKALVPTEMGFLLQVAEEEQVGEIGARRANVRRTETFILPGRDAPWRGPDVMGVALAAAGTSVLASERTPFWRLRSHRVDLSNANNSNNRR
jgi:hypothetical protein